MPALFLGVRAGDFLDPAEIPAVFLGNDRRIFVLGWHTLPLCK